MYGKEDRKERQRDRGRKRERKLISYVRIRSLSIKNINDSNDDYVKLITKTKKKTILYLSEKKWYNIIRCKNIIMKRSNNIYIFITYNIIRNLT